MTVGFALLGKPTTFSPGKVVAVSLVEPGEGCREETFEGTSIRVVDERPDKAVVCR